MFLICIFYWCVINIMSVYSTIESTHGRILDKIAIIKKAVNELQNSAQTYQNFITELTNNDVSGAGSVSNSADNAKKQTANIESPMALLESLQLNLIKDLIESTENEYVLAIAHVLGNYYSTIDNESKNTKEFYRIITSENISGKLSNVLRISDIAVNKFNRAIQLGVKMSKSRSISVYESGSVNINSVNPRQVLKSIEDAVYMSASDLTYARSLDISEYLEKRSNEFCKCGARLQLMPETSELRCDSCFRTKKVVGSVLRDDQYSGHDGQKSKHSGYDSVRHLRFWLERLQALETKVFDEDTMSLIAYVLKRDGIIKSDLTCEIMRAVLKDTHVGATYLNDHAPLLVKKFGGVGPPTLDYHETKIIHIRFIRAMTLYDQINPLGGNKPYYPHFIYKIIEELFKDNPEKLRILNYIHLQSAETIEKNDRYYEQICEMVDDPESGLVYTSTDPSRRI